VGYLWTTWFEPSVPSTAPGLCFTLAFLGRSWKPQGVAIPALAAPVDRPFGYSSYILTSAAVRMLKKQ
jgi:hypothetical protein